MVHGNRGSDFIHLRVRSACSMLESALSIAGIAELCARNAMPAVAVTDGNNVFGAPEIAARLLEKGVQPVIGCSLSILPAADTPPGAASSSGNRAEAPAPASLPLLVQSETGYRNLLGIVSDAHLAPAREDFPCVSLDRVAAQPEGLICLTGGANGPIGQLVRHGDPAEAEAMFARLADIFPGRLYVEIQRHGANGCVHTGDEAQTEAFFLDAAMRLDLPIVATNDVLFSDPSMREAQDALICIADGETLANPDRRRFSPECWFKPADSMAALFADLPEAIERTVEIARRCHWYPTHRPLHLPRFAEDENGQLRARSQKGLTARLERVSLAASRDAYERRLASELDVIVGAGFAGYFLIVADFVAWARKQDIPVGPGRGSGTGSLVAWALAITELDPIRYGLLFERFLNRDRASMPDFDIDFCPERRDEVLRYVRDRYGADRVAQIITFGTLQARAALRDVGRVLEIPYGHVDRLCRLVPNDPGHPVSLPDVLKSEPRLVAEMDSEPQIKRLFDIAMRVEGLYRHASTHAAGVVIGDRPLNEIVPLYRDPRAEMPTTQYSMNWVESAGLVKFDLLGLKTLTLIRNALALAGEEARAEGEGGALREEARAEGEGGALREEDIPLDDPATFALYRKAETVGLFQVEGRGMRDTLRELAPDRFEDIIALVALYRPGPMDDIPRYCAAKHGREVPDFLHPAIRPVLEETYGVFVYQEQVMQAAQILAGFSLREADHLRRAMGKKIPAEMKAQRARFLEGAKANGLSGAKAREIFDIMSKFASYGFNKSHSAAYALVSYQTAWLKANHPLAFLAASMNLDIDNTDKLALFVREARRMAIEIVPLCINLSRARFHPGKSCIIYGLGALKNVGIGVMERIEKARVGGGAFRSLSDFARRVRLREIGKRALERLAEAGCFDSLEPDRATVYANIARLIDYSAIAHEDAESGQGSLFAPSGDAGGMSAAPLLPRHAEKWDRRETLRREREAVGFYLSAHPFDAQAEMLGRADVMSHAAFRERIAKGAARAYVAGLVESVRHRATQRGARFVTLELSDASGSYDLAVFSELYEGKGAMIAEGESLIFTLEGDDTAPRGRVEVRDIKPFSWIREKAERRARMAQTRMPANGPSRPEETSAPNPETFRVSNLDELHALARKAAAPRRLLLQISDLGVEVDMRIDRPHHVSGSKSA